MIGYSHVRTPGGPRYSSTQRQAARTAAAAGDPQTLTAEGVAAMTAPTGMRAVCDVLFEVESNRLRRPTTVKLRRGVGAVTPATGVAASLVDGSRCATPSTPAVTFPEGSGTPTVDLTWTAGRAVNVVEVHGDDASEPATSVRVSTLGANGTTWTDRGTFAAPAGRHACQIAPYDTPVTCRGVRVEILAGGSTLVEVDPMLIRDLSDDVTAVTVELAAEAAQADTADPFGAYSASTVALTIEDTEGLWNPATNASLDVGHRIEVATGVAYVRAADGVLVEELLPGGVYYSEPFDTDSDSTTVTINGTDRLGRNSSSTPAEPVAVNVATQDLLRELARTYLDLDSSQVVIDPSLAGVVFPYAYPSGDFGSYLADVSKALGASGYIDALDRLVVTRRAPDAGVTVTSITDSTSLIRFKRPPGYDTTVSTVTVTAAPLRMDVDSDLWGMPSGGVTIAQGGSYTVIAGYGSVPAVNGYVAGVVADGAYTITAAAYYADRAELTIRNDEARALVVADLHVRGNPLIETPLTARAEHAPSVARYGPRNLDLTVRLAQTQTQVNLLAAVALDAFRSLDDDGVRRLPDLTFTSLGLPHLDGGDQVFVQHAGKGVAREYVVLSRVLTYSDGALMLDEVRCREAPTFDLLTYDSGELYDDGHLVGY